MQSEGDFRAHISVIHSDGRHLNENSLFIPGDTQFDGLFVGFRSLRSSSSSLREVLLWRGARGLFNWHRAQHTFSMVQLFN